MNKPDLESILKKARLPEIPNESLDMFPRHVVARLKRNDPLARPQRSFSPHLAWALGLAACVAIAFAIGHWRGRMETGTTPATDSLASATFIRETLAMFPNRVRAIMQDERGINLVLSDNDDVPASTPIYARIYDGKHALSFVTFSGQEIQVAGQTVTVLANPRGGIILTGNQFLWSNTGRDYVDNHWKIEARSLNSIAL
jgi:hypothetical protein